MKSMSAATEQRIINALERAINDAVMGTDPSEAIAKVAQEENFNREIVKRLVEGYNVSRVLAHIRTSQSVKRAESHELADYDKVCEIMFPKNPEIPVRKPEKQASVLDDEFSLLPDFDSEPIEIPMVKAADDKTYEPEVKAEKRAIYDRVVKAAGALRQAAANASTHARNSVREVYSALKEAREALQRYEGDLQAVELAIKNAVDGKILNTLWKYAGFELSGREPEQEYMFDPNESPYKEILQFKQAAEDASKYLRDAGDVLRKYAIVRSLLPFFSAMGGGYAAHPGNKTEAAIKDFVSQLKDPLFVQELRGAKLLADLADLVENDEVISKYSASEITDALNEIRDIAPEMLVRKPALRQLLRARLQMPGMEPHEIKTITDTERRIREMAREDLKTLSPPEGGEGPNPPGQLAMELFRKVRESNPAVQNRQVKRLSNAIWNMAEIRKQLESKGIRSQDDLKQRIHEVRKSQNTASSSEAAKVLKQLGVKTASVKRAIAEPAMYALLSALLGGWMGYKHERKLGRTSENPDFWRNILLRAALGGAIGGGADIALSVLPGAIRHPLLASTLAGLTTYYRDDSKRKTENVKKQEALHNALLAGLGTAGVLGAKELL